MENIDIHVDDFALSKNNSNDILKCIINKKINSLSVIPNMSCFHDCIKLLNNNNNLPISIHLNFLEGKPVSTPKLVKNLIDVDGYFKLTWLKFFLYSFNPIVYKKIKRQLKIEIKNQIELVKPFIKKIRIDSHQHTHMIPIVFNSIMEVVEKEKYDVEFMRVSQEPLMPYIKKIKLYNTYCLKQIISNFILNILSLRIKRILRKKNIKYGYLWGVIMSGNMDINRINSLKKEMFKSCKNSALEILFHPGYVAPNEMRKELNNKKFNKFSTSKNRKKEYDTIMKLNLFKE